MKRKPIITLALVAGITSTAFAGLNAPLPEFKTAKQLVEWRAEMAAKSDSKPTATADTAFYTGKPYLASSGSYAFKYRSYNPELARWTSEDLSGFPDGANGNVYAPTPTKELDSLGLDKVTADGTTEHASAVSGGATLSFIVDIKPTASVYNNAKLQIGWVIDHSTTGWMVQNVTFDIKVYNDSGGKAYNNPNPPTTNYWEAWQVTAGDHVTNPKYHNNIDNFITPGFPDSIHGYCTISGSASYFSDSFFSPSKLAPSNWATSAIPEAHGLNATTTQPVWFTGNLSHYLTASWE